MFSMALFGPWVTFITYLLFSQCHQQKLGIFFGAALGNLVTYLVTAAQLAIAFPAESGGIMSAFIKFESIFAFTQIPLAITEGLLTVLVWNWLQSYATDELQILKLLKTGV